MGNLRELVMSWLLRWQIARLQRQGRSLLSLLPDHALSPVRREGLDPLPSDGHEQAGLYRLNLPVKVGVWVVTGRAEVRAVLSAADDYSNDFGHLATQLGMPAAENPGGLGFADPPVHTRLRRILTPEFTVRRLARLAPRIDEIINGLLDDMEGADGPIDLVESFALPIPSLVICELLGVPYSERDEFQKVASARFDLIAGASAPLGAISESLEYMREQVKRQRADPGDGLLGQIIRDYGEGIDDEELAGLADGILTGGFETTASMLTLGSLVLLQEPEAARMIREDDAAAAPIVEELLRYLAVVQIAFPRFARRELQLGGKTIAAGDAVLCSLIAANRDTGDDGSFDPHRIPGQHFAFGYGLHRCVGAELGRMELRAAYPALLRRFPGLRLAVPASELEFRDASIVYGLDRLPVFVR